MKGKIVFITGASSALVKDVRVSLLRKVRI